MYLNALRAVRPVPQEQDYRLFVTQLLSDVETVSSFHEWIIVNATRIPPRPHRQLGVRKLKAKGAVFELNRSVHSARLELNMWSVLSF